MNQFFHRLLLCTCLLLLAVRPAFAQTDSSGSDSIVVSGRDSALAITADSLAASADSLRADSIRRASLIKKEPDTSLQHFYRLNNNTDVQAPVVFRNEPPFSARQKDLVFYVLMAVVFVLAVLRRLFAKYFNDLFRIFFQTNFRQKSIREQLLQNKMASLLLNIFFCISGGLFLYFLAHFKGWLPADSFVKGAALCVALVAVVYSVKFIGLRISGWLLGMQEVMETYLFVVFLINKMVGVLLLPASLILALGSSGLQSVLLVIAIIMLVLLYLYRYVVALPLVRNHSGLTGFHFFIYLCAFEIVPVLLMYKLLIIILSK